MNSLSSLIHLIQFLNFLSLFFVFQSQTEDNPSSKMDLSVGVYHPTNRLEYIVLILGSPAGTVAVQ